MRLHPGQVAERIIHPDAQALEPREFIYGSGGARSVRH